MTWHPNTTTVFQPENLTWLKDVFDDITAQAWFDKNEDARRSFAKYLIGSFPGPDFDPVKHWAAAEVSARIFCGRE